MKDLKIKFVSHADESLAPHRMRVLKPAEILRNRGYKVSVDNVVSPDDDIVVFQKHLKPAYDFNVSTVAKNRGKKIIFDVSDNHFDNEELSQYYRAMINKADHVTCCGEGLKYLIHLATGKKAQVIKDPITFPRKNPRDISNPPKILWFGHVSNMDALKKYVHDLPNLTIISNRVIKVPNPFVKSIPWRIGLVESLIDQFDVVILPVSENKIWKNENRAVDAIQGGCFVITDTLRPYAPLRDYIFVGDILEGVAWAGANPEHAKNLVENGQKFLDENYNDDLLGDSWEEAIKKAGVENG